MAGQRGEQKLQFFVVTARSALGDWSAGQKILAVKLYSLYRGEHCHQCFRLFHVCGARFAREVKKTDHLGACRIQQEFQLGCAGQYLVEWELSLELLQGPVQLSSCQQAFCDRDALMGMEAAKTRLPVLVYLQPETLAIAEDLWRGNGVSEQRECLLQRTLGGTLEQVGNDLLFDLKLLRIVAVLEVATATGAVSRAWRRDAVGGGRQDLGGSGLGKALFLQQDSGLDGFARQDVAEQDDLAIAPAGQAVSAIDYFFNAERGVAHFFNDVSVDEMVFWRLIAFIALPG